MKKLFKIVHDEEVLVVAQNLVEAINKWREWLKTQWNDAQRKNCNEEVPDSVMFVDEVVT